MQSTGFEPVSPSLKARCCAAVGIDQNSERAAVIERAASIADAWYESHPMPMGCAKAAERHHKACSSHVSSEIRLGCGVITWLTIVSCLFSICYTVWSWRREVENDR